MGSSEESLRVRHERPPQWKDFRSFSFLCYHDGDSELQNLINKGNYGRNVLTGLTGDFLMQRLYKMMTEEPHRNPICPKMPDQPRLTAQTLGLVRTGEMVTSYLSEKEINPNLRMSDCSEMHRLDEVIHSAEQRAPGCFDLEKLRSAFPRFVEEAFKDAKQMITEIINERAIAKVVALG